MKKILIATLMLSMMSIVACHKTESNKNSDEDKQQEESRFDTVREENYDYETESDLNRPSEDKTKIESVDRKLDD